MKQMKQIAKNFLEGESAALNVHTKFLKIAILEHTFYRISINMRFFEDITQIIFNDSIKQNQKLGSPVNRRALRVQMISGSVHPEGTQNMGI